MVSKPKTKSHYPCKRLKLYGLHQFFAGFATRSFCRVNGLTMATRYQTLFPATFHGKKERSFHNSPIIKMGISRFTEKRRTFFFNKSYIPLPWSFRTSRRCASAILVEIDETEHENDGWQAGSPKTTQYHLLLNNSCRR